MCKKIILFPEGSSGHFLSEFLSRDCVAVTANYRIDYQQMTPSSVFISTNNTASGLEKLILETMNGNREFVLSHHRNVSDLRRYGDRFWIRKIFPLSNKFGYLKNVFYKKQTVERIDWTQTSFVMQLDNIFLNIDDWYHRLSNDNDLPNDLIIDFGKISDINFLIDLYQEAQTKMPSSEKIDFAIQYIALQSTIEDCADLDMQTIIDKIQPKNLFDLAAAWFIYEKNHNTVDSNRLYTIDDIPCSIDAASTWLVKNSRNYTIF